MIRGSQNDSLEMQPPKKKVKVSEPVVRKMEIKKNTRIQGKISSVLETVLENTKDKYTEVELVAQSEGTQKMLTIVEIVKQKLDSLPGKKRKDRHKAKTEDQSIIVIGDKQVESGRIRYDSYQQYNRLESVREKKEPRPPKKVAKRLQLDTDDWSDLMADSYIHRPVLRIRFRFYSSSEPLETDEQLVKKGWSRQ